MIFVASRLEPGLRTDGLPLTAVILGDEVPLSVAVAAALDEGLWQVGDASTGGKVAAVAVVDRVTAEDAPVVVANAQVAGDAVIVVIGEPTAEAVRALLRAGADAVVPGDGVAAQLGPAMAAVQAGLVVAPAGVLAQSAGGPALTPREKQALAMVVLGFSNADIANKLYVMAESAVKSHLSSAFAKLGVRTRSEATAVILDRSNGFGTGILAIVGDGDADSA